MLSYNPPRRWIRSFCEKAITIAHTLTSHTSEYVKALWKVNKSLEEDQEIYEGQLANLRKKFDESLDQTIKEVYNAQLKALCSGVQFLRLQLNP